MKSNQLHPSQEQLKAYLNGTCSPEEAHAIEMQALDDPFLADAIEGFEENGGWDLVDQTNAQLPSPTPSLPKFLFGGFAFAMIAFLAFWYFQPEQATSSEKQGVTAQKETQLPANTAEGQNEEIASPAPKLVFKSGSSDSTVSFTSIHNGAQKSAEKESFVEVQEFTPKQWEELNLEPIDIEDYLEDDLDLSEPEKKFIREESNSIYHIEKFKVVDYREIRSEGITVEQLSYDGGLPANKENHNSSNEPLIQRTQEQIAYVDYLEEAMILFAKGKYRKANKMYDLILEHYPDDANALFYSGMCNYHLGNYGRSESLFLAPVGDQINTFVQETEYYLALTYRRSKQKEKACNLYGLIIERADFYAEAAEKEQERFCN